MTRRVAVLGGGPAGAALGTHLARRKARVVLFDPGKRAPLIVGESLVPAVIPLLRELGVEKEVAGYGMLKPGATFVFGENDTISVRFDEARGVRTNYAYNVPRDRLDASLLAAAQEAGVVVERRRAQVGVGAGPKIVALQGETKDAAEEHLGGPPDLVVDATGRSRLLSQVLSLPTENGPRRDTALFAHMEGVPLVEPGNVHVDLLDHGWAWRIPLPERVSLGLVVPSSVLTQFGERIEEQYDNYLATDSVIARWGSGLERKSPVLRYTNYQALTLEGVGPGWALVGDAFGFVDPVFSSGLLIALDAARVLARAIVRGCRPKAMSRYESRVARHIRTWQRAVSYFYDGRLLTLFKVGENTPQNIVTRLMELHLKKHLPRVFTGEGTTGRYSIGLLSLLCQHALGNHNPMALAVR